MKKSIAFLTSLAMGVALVGCGSKGNENGLSGTGVGTAQGRNGEVKVSLTLKDGKITEVKAEGKEETPGIGDKALELMPERIVEGNSLNVDMVASATITSEAVVEASKNALVQLGANPDDYMVSTSDTPVGDIEKDADIVVVGAGGAGMVAAIEASDAKKKVIVVESQPVAGGNSVRATGGMNAAVTPAQKDMEFAEESGVLKTLEKAKQYPEDKTIQKLAETVKSQYDAYVANPDGYFDSIELYELDTMIGGKGKNQFPLVETLCNNANKDVEWLNTIGIALPSVGQFGGASVKRIHRPLNEEGKVVAVGAYMIPLLEKNLKDRNVEVLYDTTAEQIFTDKKTGNVAGIYAKGIKGNKVTINAPVVILATGGFGANHEMVEKYRPELKGFASTNANGAMGQGIVMATELGAGTIDLDQIQIHPTVHLDDQKNASLITEGLRGDGAILVNKEGKRFIDEVGTRDVVSAAEIAQPDSMAWLIVDSAMKEKSSVISKYIKNGFAKEGETIKDLAKATGMPEDVLEETLATWNKSVEAKEDKEFGRTAFAEPLATGPFYAISVTPGIHHTMGGLTINEKAEVLGQDGKTVIPGLYACGEVTGGVHGANRLGGNAVADFVVFGRIAGENAAKFEAK